MQKIGLPLALFIVFTTTVVFAQGALSGGSSWMTGKGESKRVLAMRDGSAVLGREGLKESSEALGREGLKEGSEALGREGLKESSALLGREGLKESSALLGRERLKESSAVLGREGLKEGSEALGREGLKEGSLRVQGDSLILSRGREVLLNKQGFPQQVWLDSAGEREALLAENVHFHFISQVDGKDLRLKNGQLEFGKKGRRRVQWSATSESDRLVMYVEGEMTDLGVITFRVRATALQDIDLKDVVMHIPMEKAAAKSMQGLGRSGDYGFDSIYHWKWAPENRTAEAWVGRGKMGLGFTLKRSEEWWNGGKGGVDIGIKGKSMLVNNYSGARHMKKGETIYYIFNLNLHESL